MLIDQNEIDTLLNQADNLASEASVATAAPQSPPPPAPALNLPDDPDIHRLLRIRVPVIVRLASRVMSVSAVRQLATGAIIEFEKSVEEELDLLINNHHVGRGTCVKIGEHFGLRLTRVTDKVTRIKSMGR